MKTQKVILLLGGNQGRVISTFAAAVVQIERQAGRLLAVSSVYSSRAWGPIPQADFLNMAIAIETNRPPGVLMLKLLDIEKQFGRKREVRYGPRTLDIDILFYGNKRIRQTHLRVPHAELAQRRFALVPAAELAPQYRHPELGKTLQELLFACPDAIEVKKWKP